MPFSPRRTAKSKRRIWSVEQLEARRLLAIVPEVESNDSTATATVFTATPIGGDTLTGSVARASDADYFQVALNQGQQITVNYSSLSFSDGVTAGIEILNPQGQVVARRYLAEEAQYLAPAAGNYYIRASSSADIGTFGGAYELSVTYSTQSFTAETEPTNNTLGGASAIANGVYFGGTVSTTSDSDFYSINSTLTAGQSIAISFVGAPSANAPAVKLYDGSNTVVASDLLGRGLVTTIPTTGNYKFEISPTRSDGTFTGSYFASVSARSVASTTPTGSDFSSSQSLGASSQLTSVAGRLSTLVETHVYTIQTTDLEQINAAFAFNGQNRLLRLYDEQGRLLTYAVNGTISTGTPDFSRSPGKFFLTVQALQDSALGPYQLVFTTNSFSKQRDVPLFFLDFTSQIDHLGFGKQSFTDTSAIGFVQGMFESRYEAFDVDVTQTLPTNTSEFVGQGYGNYTNLGAGGWGGGNYGVRRPDGDSVVAAGPMNLTSLNYGATTAMNHELGHGVGLLHLRSPRGLMSYDTQQPVYPYGSGYSFIAGDSYFPVNYQENSRDYLDFVLQSGRQILETEPNDSLAAAAGVDRYLAEMSLEYKEMPTAVSSGATRSMELLDFNKDGNQDLIWLRSANEFDVYLGDASGLLFRQGIITSIPFFSVYTQVTNDPMAAGDIDADGFSDFLVSGTTLGGSRQLYVFKGNPTGTMNVPLPITVPGTGDVGSVELVDLNKDGKLDVVIGTNAGQIYTALNNGTGGFGTFNVTALPGTAFILDMTSGDVDGDTFNDLLVTNGTGGFGVVERFTVLRGKGDGTFQPAVNYSTGNLPTTVALWDFDNNGKLDVVVGSTVSRQLQFFTNNGSGSFSLVSSFAYTNDFSQLVVADLNGDSRQDLVAASSNGPLAFLSLPDGTRSDAIRLPSYNNSGDAVVYDANKDGIMDVISGNGAGIGINAIFGQPNDPRNDRAVVIGNIATSADADFYSFTATAGQTWAIDVDSAEFQNSLDAVLTVFDNSGVALATNNDALDRESGVDSVDPYLMFTAPAAGTYKVKISGVRETVGDYRLKLTPQAAFDTAGPRVIGSSLTGASNIATRQIVLMFNDQLDPAKLAGNIQVVGTATGVHMGTATFDPIDSTLVWTTDETLPIDTYTVTLTSGAGGITDLRGNALDGEASAGFAFPQVSGNGVAGGNFSYQFGVNSMGVVSGISSTTYRRDPYNRGLFELTFLADLSIESVANLKAFARGAGADGSFFTSDDRIIPLDALVDKVSPKKLNLYTRGIPDADFYRLSGTLVDSRGNTIDLANQAGVPSPSGMAMGVDVPESALFVDAALTTNGLTGSYVNFAVNGALDDTWVGVRPISGTRVDPNVHFAVDEFGSRAQVGITGGTDANWDNFSAQWDGYLNVTVPGTRVYTKSNDGSRLWIDVNHNNVIDGGEYLTNAWGGNGPSTTTGAVSNPLAVGVYKIRIQYETKTGANEMLLEWATPDFSGQIENVAHGPSIIDTSIQPHSNIAANSTSDIAVTFSGAVKLTTLTTSNFKVRYSPDPTFYDANDTFLADADNTIAWDATTHKATFTTANKLAAGYYQVEVNGDPGGVTSNAGNLLDGEFLDSYIAGTTNWTWQDSPSGDGIAGGDYLASFSVSTAPQIIGITTDTGASSIDRVTSDTTLILQGRAVANATIDVQLGGVAIGTTTSNASGDWTFDYTGTTLTAGVKSFTATSTVATVTSSPSEAFVVTIDNTIAAPALTSMTTDSGASATDRITTDRTLVFMGTAEAGSTVTLTLTGTGTIGTFTAGAITGKWTFDYSGTSLADGTYTFTINSLDLAGNFAATPFNVTVDNTAAAPVFTAMADDTGTSPTDRITRDSQIILSGTAEANSTLTLRTGSGGGPVIGTTTANASGNWTFDYTGTTLADGVYAFFASIVDLAGNTSAASSPGFTVTIDTTPPAISPAQIDLAAASDTFQAGACGSSTDNITSDNTPTFTGLAAAGVSVEVLVDGNSVGTTTAIGDGTFSFTTGIIADGAHNITWRAFDLAGNTTPQSPALTITIDTGAPTLAAIGNIVTNEDVTADIPLALGDIQPPANLCVVSQFSSPINAAAITIDTSGGYNWVLHAPPLANQSGSTNATITAYDIAGNASPARGFNLFVQAVNDAPTAVGLVGSTVVENSVAATIGIVSVTDVDVGDTHTWSVDDARFEIVGTTLKLKSGQALDFEAGNPTINITVTDSGNLSKSQSFLITVTNVNEAPTSVGLSNQSVSENAAGAAVGNITAVDPDVGDTLTLTVSDSRFEIAGTTLKLKPGVSLDAEATPSIDLSITATDAGALFKTQAFTITVVNVNEAPTDIALSSTSFAENLTNVAIATITVTDPDSAAPFNFTVNDSRLEIISGVLRIKPGQSFDFETTPGVSINITATDGGGLGFTKPFTLTVTNVNEAPTSVGLSANSVPENSAANTLIGNLSAVDPDTGSTLAFSITDPRFTISGNQLRTAQAFDFEATPSINLDITATDGGGLTKTQTFTINVTNVNEAPTAVNLSNNSVSENAAGANVGNVTVSDPDVGNIHNITVSDNRFEVVGGVLRLIAGQSLDREAAPTIGITITATDGGGLSKSQGFTINVTNVDEAPTAISLSANTVSENASGVIIGAVTVTDPEGGPFTFGLSDNRFSIVGGNLRLDTPIDFETTPSLSLTITATDPTSLSKAQAFTINVTNVNEAPAQVQLLNTTIAENVVAGVIGNVSFVDPDAGDTQTWFVNDARFEVVGNQLKLKAGQSLDHEAAAPQVQITVRDAGGLEGVSTTYTLTVTNVNEAPTAVLLSANQAPENNNGFVIGTLSATDPDIGETFGFSTTDSRFTITGNQLAVAANANLDFEATPSIGITVTATDAGGLTKSQAFTIVVTDQNDAPSAIALSANSVAENSAGATIGNVTVTDQDAGATFTFVVSDSRFEIVAGALRLKTGNALNFEAEPSVVLNIQATDNGGLSLTRPFTINVTNVNEAPTTVSLSASTVAENSVGAIIGNVSGTDPDAGETLTFTVNDARFEVDAGQLKLLAGQALDFETEPSVPITITAHDAGGLTKAQAFTVTVTNVNEAPTNIVLSNASVAENAAGATIGSLTVSDPDAGATHTFTVSDARFEVVGTQLKLKTGQALDFEAESSVLVTVTATDQGLLALPKDFTITVTNVNEAPTAILPSSDTIIENRPAGIVTHVALSVLDPDAGDTHAFAVSDNRFEIVNSQLKLKAGQSLDFEAMSIVVLNITATDAGGLSIQLPFTVTVINENEAPSNVLLSQTHVAENSPGAAVGNLSAIDPDAGDTHTFIVSDSRFEIISQQLKLKSGVALDFEAIPSVSLQVTATDLGGLSKTQSFVIDVDNVNEAPTAIGISPLTIPEIIAGGVIGTVAVTDPDQSETFTYEVSDPRFVVTADQLRLAPGVALDFETTSSVNVTVEATDSGGLKVSNAFTVSVVNLNEAPTAIGTAFNPINENAPGAVIGTLSVTDPDSNPPFTLTVADARFEIVGSQLKLKAGQSLDYEAGANVSVSVTARDSGNLAFTQAVTVTVLNVAEAPTDIRLSREKIFNNLAGAWVADVQVIDSDASNAFNFTVSDARFEVRGDRLYLKPGQTIADPAGTQIPLRIDVQDPAAGGSFGKNFSLLVENGPANWNFAHQWKPNRLDVNADGVVSPLDALLVINELNAVGPSILSPAPGGTLGPLFLDVSGDNSISPLDALEVIIYLNSGAGGEGEAAAAADAALAEHDAFDPHSAAWLYAWWETFHDAQDQD